MAGKHKSKHKKEKKDKKVKREEKARSAKGKAMAPKAKPPVTRWVTRSEPAWANWSAFSKGPLEARPDDRAGKCLSLERMVGLCPWASPRPCSWERSTRCAA